MSAITQMSSTAAASTIGKAFNKVAFIYMKFYIINFLSAVVIKFHMIQETKVPPNKEVNLNVTDFGKSFQLHAGQNKDT